MEILITIIAVAAVYIFIMALLNVGDDD